MKRSSFLPLAIFVLCVWTAPLVEGDVFTNGQAKQLRDFVKNLIQCRGVTGMSVGVVKGQDVWNAGFGLGDRRRLARITPDCLFSIASITKTFTSALLSMLLKESGKYTWNSPVVDIVGNDSTFGNDELTEELTLKDMLTHRTGLATAALPLAARIPNLLRKADLGRRIKYLPTKHQFRDQHDYNTLVYSLAGLVIEKLGGATYGELLQKRILRPLRMKNTRIYDAVHVSRKYTDYAKPYVDRKTRSRLSDYQLYNPGSQEASMGLSSSARDMVEWLYVFLNKGRSRHGDVLLDEATVKEMTGTAVSTPPNSHDNIFKPTFPVTFVGYGYGYGWNTGMYRGYRMVFHSGGIWAYRTYVAFIPDLNMGVFVATNGLGNTPAGHSVREVFYYITDLLLGEDHWLDKVTACRFPEYWEYANQRFPSPGIHTQNENFDVYDGTSPTPIIAPNPTPIVPGSRLYSAVTTSRNSPFLGYYGHPLYGHVVVYNTVKNGLGFRYGTIWGRLTQLDSKQPTERWVKVKWPMDFFFFIGQMRVYIKCVFSQPSSNGTYHRVKLSIPFYGLNDDLPFQRGVLFNHL